MVEALVSKRSNSSPIGFISNQYNLRVKSISMMKKAENTNQHYLLHPNKENITLNTHKKDLSHRHRNDHSIQAKSPIKIPLSSLKKDDLTFRLKASAFLHHSPPHLCTQEDLKSEDCIQTLPTLTKQQMHSQLRNSGRSQRSAKHKESDEEIIYVNEHECQLIDNLWEICNRLKITQNQYLRESLNIIHLEIRKMIALIGENSTQDNAPLASSKKIKLQNYIAHSHCQKEIYHKQFESESKNQFQNSRVSPSEISPEVESEYQHNFKRNELEGKEDLEVKKIMYMLEGKQIKIENSIMQNCSAVSGRMRSERLSSLSSFNQNASEDSGFTVFQIQRCQDAPSLRSENDARKKGTRNPGEQKGHERQQSMNSQEGSRVSEDPNVGNKRKVLNDIVAMLNFKYNKNIRLD